MEIFVYTLIAIGAFAGAFVLAWLVFGAFIKAGENRQIREYVREYATTLNEQSTITRQNIVDWTRTMGDINITVRERADDPQMPHSLRWNNKTFALAYGTDAGVLLIVWITDDYAARISKSHRIDRAKFPKGPYWWTIPLDQTWTNKEMVMELLKNSVGYVSKRK
ncbi:MAG: hypothetical protein FWE31_05540 [Firmicutes bacterium]|nr:hypothetical protein [Bacillota bacterium]